MPNSFRLAWIPFGVMVFQALPGCQSANVPGVVSGTLLYNGEPAVNRRVSLVGNVSAKTMTDGNGRYFFRNVQQQPVQVFFQSQAPGPRQVPNEVAQWRSPVITDGVGSGVDIPAFDLAFNQLLYPENGVALVVDEETVVPFHWSTHAQAKQYRIRITGANQFKWMGEHTRDSSAIFSGKVPRGRYEWVVEIDAGDRGTAISWPRSLDF